MNKKSTRRVQLIFGSLFAQFAVPVSNIAVSILVVRWFSAELWGGYVEHLLVVSLALTVVHWGSKDYLSKQFSKAPKNISLDLQRSMVGKVLLLLVLSFILGLIPLPGLEKDLILAWIWSRAFWQFFESLNTYRRLFFQVAMVEVVLVLGMIGCIFQFEVSIRLLLSLFIGMDVMKLMVYSFFNRSYLWPWRGDEGWKSFFRESFPFFLLTLSSLAASRADVYLLSLWEEAQTLAQYQIITNFIQYAHLLATAIMLPFLKNIFRLQFASIQELEKRFIGLGVILGVLLTGGIYMMTTFLYQFEMSYIVITLIYLNIVVFYFYFLRIPAGFSFNRMWSVIIVMSLMGGINLVLSILIIPTLGIIGGLFSSLSAGLLGLLGFRSKKLFHFT